MSQEEKNKTTQPERDLELAQAEILSAPEHELLVSATRSHAGVAGTFQVRSDILRETLQNEVIRADKLSPIAGDLLQSGLDDGKHLNLLEANLMTDGDNSLIDYIDANEVRELIRQFGTMPLNCLFNEQYFIPLDGDWSWADSTGRVGVELFDSLPEWANLIKLRAIEHKQTFLRTALEAGVFRFDEDLLHEFIYQLLLMGTNKDNLHGINMWEVRAEVWNHVPDEIVSAYHDNFDEIVKSGYSSRYGDMHKHGINYILMWSANWRDVRSTELTPTFGESLSLIGRNLASEEHRDLVKQFAKSLDYAIGQACLNLPFIALIMDDLIHSYGHTFTQDAPIMDQFSVEYLDSHPYRWLHEAQFESYNQTAGKLFTGLEASKIVDKVLSDIQKVLMNSKAQEECAACEQTGYEYSPSIGGIPPACSKCNGGQTFNIGGNDDWRCLRELLEEEVFSSDNLFVCVRNGAIYGDLLFCLGEAGVCYNQIINEMGDNWRNYNQKKEILRNLILSSSRSRVVFRLGHFQPATGIPSFRKVFALGSKPVQKIFKNGNEDDIEFAIEMFRLMLPPGATNTEKYINEGVQLYHLVSKDMLDYSAIMVNFRYGGYVPSKTCYRLFKSLHINGAVDLSKERPLDAVNCTRSTQPGIWPTGMRLENESEALNFEQLFDGGKFDFGELPQYIIDRLNVRLIVATRPSANKSRGKKRGKAPLVPIYILDDARIKVRSQGNRLVSRPMEAQLRSLPGLAIVHHDRTPKDVFEASIGIGTVSEFANDPALYSRTYAYLKTLETGGIQLPTKVSISNMSTVCLNIVRNYINRLDHLKQWCKSVLKEAGEKISSVRYSMKLDTLINAYAEVYDSAHQPRFEALGLTTSQLMKNTFMRGSPIDTHDYYDKILESELALYLIAEVHPKSLGSATIHKKGGGEDGR